jgi:phage-related baseplate assembly protein
MSFSIFTLFTPETAERIFDIGIGLAKLVGLPVDSWRTGDPTRALYKHLATKLAAVDQTVANLARSAVLSVLTQAASAGDAGAIAWLKIVALEQFGIEAQEATFAASAAGQGVLLTNTGGGRYPVDPGDITFKSSITGKTYHNTTGGLIAPGPGTTLLLEFVADEAGSDSTVAANEIDTLVTTKLGIVITSSAAAVGLDEESPDSIYQRCKDSLGSLSPNGPKDAYRYVALNAKLTGITSVTRAIGIDNLDGTISIYIANPTGSATGGEVSAVQLAIDKWATPNCVTAIVGAAVGVTVNVAMTVAYGGSLSDPDLQTAIASKIAAKLAALDIGGTALTSGAKGVPRDLFIEAARQVAGVTAVTLTTPAGETVLASDEVAIPGTCTVTVV